MEIPIWAKTTFSGEQGDFVSRAIQDVEVVSKAQVLPIVVKRSGYSTRGWLTLSFAMGTIAWIVDTFTNVGAWFGENSWVVLIALAGFFLISYPLSRLSIFQKLFIIKGAPNHFALKRAELEYFKQKSVNDRPLIVILVSLEEKQVVFYCEDQLWNENYDLFQASQQKLVKALKKGKLAEELKNVIMSFSSVLQKRFPIGESGLKTLPHTITFKE